MKRVSRSTPCPICGKPDWCSVSDNGEVAFCMRIQSGMPCKNGAWLHFLKARDRSRASQHPAPMPLPSKQVVFDAARYHASIRKAWDSVWLDGNAVELGVNMDALERLQPGWDSFNKAVGYPMRDADGKVAGIRLRNSDGDKWAVAGSHDGLFYDPALVLGDDRELVICEGPTDTAAAYTLGLPAAGRSSCMTGLELLKALCFRLKVRLVTIVADSDSPKQKPDGSLWRPGIEGAMALGSKLGRLHRIVVPPKKDLREWVGSGCTLKDWSDWVSTAQRRLPA
jgi:phage/plasmid primase-like uncharacterized protein